MLILAIDSSGMTASAALLNEEKVIASMSVNNKKTHSQTLLPMIQQVMEAGEIDPEELDAIALAEGPGSFTGLRIGAALAKGLGLALDKPIIALSTVDALAYNCGPSEALICPMIDARHETVYSGLYRWGEEGFETVLKTQAITVSELADRIGETGAGNLLITGDGASVYGEALSGYLAKFETKVETAPIHLARQSAAAVGALALLRAGEATIDADAFKPSYHRLTQAERERMKKEKEK